jgi:hypothetical protein
MVMTVSVHLPGLAINTSVSWGLDVDGLDMANLDQLSRSGYGWRLRDYQSRQALNFDMSAINAGD